MMSLPAFFSGLSAMTSLIVAIGAQNNFVLRQGLMQKNVTIVILFCILSDIALVVAAVFGLTPVMDHFPTLLTILKMAGIMFLTCYAALSFKRAFSSQSISVINPSSSQASLWLSLIGFTWLNPHVWIDTIFILGAIAQTQPDADKLAFASGAGLVSIIWFTVLGYGARFLKPLFEEPVSWRALDLLTGTLMAYLATQLFLKF